MKFSIREDSLSRPCAEFVFVLLTRHTSPKKRGSPVRTEIRLSTSAQASPNPWFWWGWEQGGLVAQGQSPGGEEAQQAVRALVGHEQRSVWRRPPSGR